MGWSLQADKLVCRASTVMAALHLAPSKLCPKIDNFNRNVVMIYEISKKYNQRIALSSKMGLILVGVDDGGSVGLLAKVASNGGYFARARGNRAAVIAERLLAAANVGEKIGFRRKRAG